jgi:peptide/nickel transport system substrate-binding protein
MLRVLLRIARAVPIALLLAACGDAAERFPAVDPASVPEAERYGGTAVLPMITGLSTMNPLVVSDYGTEVVQRFILFTPLVGYDEELRPVPRLAEAWDTVRVAPDTLELTFRLRDDVHWHDGEPVTARDVLFTWERMNDPATAYGRRAKLELWDPEAELVDERTIRFRLRAHPEFMEVWFVTPPVPEHILGEVPPERLRDHPYGTREPVGNGPFRFVRHLPNREWVFEANEDHPEALGGRPYLDRVVYRQIPDFTTLLTEILTGRVDLAGVRPEHVGRIEASPRARLETFTLPQWTFIAWNTRNPLFADARVRRALTMALDREGMVEGVLHGIPPLGRSPVPPSHWAYLEDDPQTWIPHDPERARERLAEAGWRDRTGDGVLEDAEGRPFRFTMKTRQGNDSWREITEIAQAQLGRLGIEVRPRIVEAGTLMQDLQGTVRPDGTRERDFDAVVLNWVEDFAKDDRPILHSDSREHPAGWTGYANPEVDMLLDSLAVIMDRERARPYWEAYQRRIVQESPFTVIYYGTPLVAVSRRLQGVEMDARGSLVSIERWWIPPELR